MAFNWGNGTYEVLAETLMPACHVAVEAMGDLAGVRVLDVGCGSGNAALMTAERGAVVTAVDPAERLVEVAAARAAEKGLTIITAVGDGAKTNQPEHAFDMLVSVFAVIFAPDAAAVAKEMHRVIKPGGRMVMTAWLPEGPIFAAGRAMRAELSAGQPAPPADAPPPPRWHDNAFIAEVFGVPVTTAVHAIPFHYASSAAWVDAMEAGHPMWQSGARTLGGGEGWTRVRQGAMAALDAGNQAKDGTLEVHSTYAVHILQF